MKTVIEVLKTVAIGSGTIMLTGYVLYLLNQGKAGATLQGVGAKITAGYGISGGVAQA